MTNEELIKFVDTLKQGKIDFFLKVKPYIQENKIYTKDIKDKSDIEVKSWYSYVGQQTTRDVGTYHKKDEVGENTYFEFNKVDVNTFYELIENKK